MRGAAYARRKPFGELRRRGGRHRHEAVSAPDGSRAELNRRRNYSVRAEQLEAHRRSRYVYYGVYRPHLVKADVADFAPVDFCLGLRKDGKDFQGIGLGPIRQPRIFNQLFYFRKRPVSVRMGMPSGMRTFPAAGMPAGMGMAASMLLPFKASSADLFRIQDHARAGSGYAEPALPRKFEPPPSDSDCSQPPLELGWIRPRVHERPEIHVAAYARETVVIKSLHKSARNVRCGHSARQDVCAPRIAEPPGPNITVKKIFPKNALAVRRRLLLSLLYGQ